MGARDQVTNIRTSFNFDHVFPALLFGNLLTYKLDVGDWTSIQGVFVNTNRVFETSPIRTRLVTVRAGAFSIWAHGSQEWRPCLFPTDSKTSEVVNHVNRRNRIHYCALIILIY